MDSCTPKVQPGDLPSLPFPLKLAVVGAPFSGKTRVAQDLAKRHNLKLLDVELLVAEAVKAATEYVAPPPPAPPPPAAEGEDAPAVEASPEVPQLVMYGQQIQECLAQGRDLPDHLSVALLVRAMQAVGEAPPAPVETDPKKAAAAAKSKAASGEPEKLPQGFVVDGFPRTTAQSEALERALTGLDLTQEAELVAASSVVAPPPAGALPQVGS